MMYLKSDPLIQGVFEDVFNLRFESFRGLQRIQPTLHVNEDVEAHCYARASIHHGMQVSLEIESGISSTILAI